MVKWGGGARGLREAQGYALKRVTLAPRAPYSNPGAMAQDLMRILRNGFKPGVNYAYLRVDYTLQRVIHRPHQSGSP